MKFEKLSENKIRITFSINDLQEKDINFHDFMSNSIESQDLFLDILEEAEEKIGFKTKDYRVKIEALAMTDGDFIVTVTRIIPESEKIHITPKKKLKVRRKRSQTEAKQIIYKFDTFDDYCYFIQFLFSNNFFNITNISKKSTLYMYKNQYYLILSEINLDHKELLKFYTSITEFGTYINNSILFISKLNECGQIVIKNNALETGLKHFKS